MTSPRLVLITRETQEQCQHGVPIEDQTDIIAISCGHTHTVALSREREVWVWGSGQGLGISQKFTASPVVLERLVGRNVLGISCGFFHTLAVVERSILDDSYSSVKTRRSRASETHTHKNLPKTCAKCNVEIYTFLETSDTCIINDEHLCKCDNEENSSTVQEKVGEKSRTRDSCDNDDVFENPEGTIGEKSLTEIPQIKEEQSEDRHEEDIWVKQESLHTTEHVSGGSPEQEGMEKCPGSNRLTAQRSVSFVNQEEARKYLAEQYEDKLAEEECPQHEELASPTSTLGGLLSSVQIYPSDMISHISSVPQQMTSMTSRAFSSLTDRLGFTSESKPRDTASESSGMGSQLFLAFDTSEEDLVIPGVEDVNTQATKETSFINESCTSDTTDRLSLRTLEAKQENISKKATVGMSNA